MAPFVFPTVSPAWVPTLGPTIAPSASPLANTSTTTHMPTPLPTLSPTAAPPPTFSPTSPPSATEVSLLFHDPPVGRTESGRAVYAAPASGALTGADRFTLVSPAAQGAPRWEAEGREVRLEGLGEVDVMVGDSMVAQVLVVHRCTDTFCSGNGECVHQPDWTPSCRCRQGFRGVRCGGSFPPSPQESVSFSLALALAFSLAEEHVILPYPTHAGVPYGATRCRTPPEPTPTLWGMVQGGQRGGVEECGDDPDQVPSPPLPASRAAKGNLSEFLRAGISVGFHGAAEIRARGVVRALNEFLSSESPDCSEVCTSALARQWSAALRAAVPIAFVEGARELAHVAGEAARMGVYLLSAIVLSMSRGGINWTAALEVADIPAAAAMTALLRLPRTPVTHCALGFLWEFRAGLTLARNASRPALSRANPTGAQQCASLGASTPRNQGMAFAAAVAAPPPPYRLLELARWGPEEYDPILWWQESHVGINLTRGRQLRIVASGWGTISASTEETPTPCWMDPSGVCVDCRLAEDCALAEQVRKGLCVTMPTGAPSTAEYFRPGDCAWGCEGRRQCELARCTPPAGVPPPAMKWVGGGTQCVALSNAGGGWVPNPGCGKLALSLTLRLERGLEAGKLHMLVHSVQERGERAELALGLVRTDNMLALVYRKSRQTALVHSHPFPFPDGWTELGVVDLEPRVVFLVNGEVLDVVLPRGTPAACVAGDLFVGGSGRGPRFAPVAGLVSGLRVAVGEDATVKGLWRGRQEAAEVACNGGRQWQYGQGCVCESGWWSEGTTCRPCPAPSAGSSLPRAGLEDCRCPPGQFMDTTAYTCRTEREGEAPQWVGLREGAG
eukprot:Hpha_TRINITY_DN15094_c1_g3::TRINITY_DN15094_c1_g3_i2::g.123793::m.123793